MSRFTRTAAALAGLALATTLSACGVATPAAVDPSPTPTTSASTPETAAPSPSESTPAEKAEPKLTLTAAQAKAVDKTLDTFFERFLRYGSGDDSQWDFLSGVKKVTTEEFREEWRFGFEDGDASPNPWEYRADHDAEAGDSVVWQQLQANGMRTWAKVKKVDSDPYVEKLSDGSSIVYLNVTVRVGCTPAGSAKIKHLPWAKSETVTARASLVETKKGWKVALLWSPVV